MADKFRKTYPLKVTFGEGEQPTGQKLSAISEQARNGLALVEEALGDPWNQSGDSVFTTYPLLIPTLARMIGQNKYLNPVIYPMVEDVLFTESIGEKYQGYNECYLTYKPKDATVAAITSSGTNITGNPETDEKDVIANGQYWVDQETGRFRSFQALSGDETVSYTIDSTEWVIGDETLPGIIPDPRQADYTSCRIEDTGTKYILHFPPRLPIVFDSGDDRERPVSYPSSLASEVTANSATADTGTPWSFWQDPSYAAFDDAHYRYAFPKEIQEAIVATTLGTGDTVPSGFFYIYDSTNDVLLEDVVFKIPSSGNTGWTLEVSSLTYDFSAVAATTEVEASYNSSGLIFVTCGSPVSRTLWSMMSTLFKHEHNKGQTLDSSVKHTSLTNVNPPAADYATGDGHHLLYPTYLPAWSPSNWSHDVHTSLLSRAGSQGGTDERDLFDNAMLGHLVMGQADTAGGNLFLDSALAAYDSFRIYFGDVTGPSLHGEKTTGKIIATSTLEATTLEGVTGNITTVNAAGVVITGASDVTHLTVKAYSSQTNANPIIELQASDNTPIMAISSDGASNIFIGVGVGILNTSGAAGNVFVGNNSGQANTSGNGNTSLGHATLNSVVTASYNTAVGTNALTNNTGASNTAVGNIAGQSNTSGVSNTFVGSWAARYNQTGSYNVVIGKEAGRGVTLNSYSNNTLVGHGSGAGLRTGGNNTCLGLASGQSLTTGANNILIGYAGGDDITDGTDNIIIGYDLNAGGTSVTNVLNIGGTITGDLSAGDITIANDLTVTNTTKCDDYQFETAATSHILYIGPTNITYEISSSDVQIQSTGLYAIINGDDDAFIPIRLPVGAVIVNFAVRASNPDGAATVYVRLYAKDWNDNATAATTVHALNCGGGGWGDFDSGVISKTVTANEVYYLRISGEVGGADRIYFAGAKLTYTTTSLGVYDHTQ